MTCAQSMAQGSRTECSEVVKELDFECECCNGVVVYSRPDQSIWSRVRSERVHRTAGGVKDWTCQGGEVRLKVGERKKCDGAGKEGGQSVSRLARSL